LSPSALAALWRGPKLADFKIGMNVKLPEPARVYPALGRRRGVDLQSESTDATSGQSSMACVANKPVLNPYNMLFATLITLQRSRHATVARFWRMSPAFYRVFGRFWTQLGPEFGWSVCLVLRVLSVSCFCRWPDGSADAPASSFRWERLAVASSKNSDASPPPADRRPVEIEGLQPSIPTELYVVAA